MEYWLGTAGPAVIPFRSTILKSLISSRRRAG